MKFREVAGISQHGIKGNTITFPQDTQSLVSCLPLDIDILPDIIKVVFIGNRKPSKRQLKKVLQVRRKKVMDALKCLKEIHELYKDIQLDHHLEMKLPEEDIPDSVWNTVTYYNDITADKAPPQ